MSMKKLQTGTGLHVDCNPYNFFQQEVDDEGRAPAIPLDRWRPVQVGVVLTDQQRHDSSLEVAPGFHSVLLRYYALRGRKDHRGQVTNRAVRSLGPYITKFRQEDDALRPFFEPIGRIPEGWDPERLPPLQDPCTLR
eukprot:gnl/Hemi2/10907_TR3742_c0_g1_i1.p1 gnl/Hemi2/10907_TR3742_c0_g1~~gnl/Hemi2/10907_TR3742_c0_g1_i1.p1  ORF type:complete len:137 (+),score=23.77 gnl/Hemi2/10907_TR3742_c0_g1_i1:79-489(+)